VGIGLLLKKKILYLYIKIEAIMTTIIINEKTKKGRIILDLIREINGGKIIENDKKAVNAPNDTTLKAIQEASEGKTIQCLDFEDYLIKV
jgi:hypothetical protein